MGIESLKSRIKKLEERGKPLIVHIGELNEDGVVVTWDTEESMTEEEFSKLEGLTLLIQWVE